MAEIDLKQYGITGTTEIFCLFIGLGFVCSFLLTIPEIQEEDIPKLSHYADKEANPLYPVPVLMDAQELEKFYYMLMPAKENTVQ